MRKIEGEVGKEVENEAEKENLVGMKRNRKIIMAVIRKIEEEGKAEVEEEDSKMSKKMEEWEAITMKR